MNETRLRAITKVALTNNTTTITIAGHEVVTAPDCVLQVGNETVVAEYDEGIGVLAFARCFICGVGCTAVQKIKGIRDLRPNLFNKV